MSNSIKNKSYNKICRHGYLNQTHYDTFYYFRTRIKITIAPN